MGEELAILRLGMIVLSLLLLMMVIVPILTSNDQPEPSRRAPKVKRVYLTRTPSGKVYVYED